MVVDMAKVGKAVVPLGGGGGGVRVVEGEEEVDLLHGLPSERKEAHPLYDLAVRTKEVLVAKGVVEEVRRKLMQFRGESPAEKEKEKLEREAESRVEEKSRAAAWAWYQHGNSGAPAIGAPNSLSSRAGAPHCGARKASRFKTEAQKVGNHSGRVEPRWDFETSLFDSYELDSVSKQIDHAFHDNCNKPVLPSATATVPPAKLTRSHSLRLSFPRSLCRSISDVVTPNEMALGVRKSSDGAKERPRRTAAVVAGGGSGGGGGWSFRKISKAINVLINVPAWDFQGQEQQNQNLSAHHHHERHEHHHHEHHHHHHYSVRLKDGTHYGKSFSSTERVKAADPPFPSYPKAR